MAINFPAAPADGDVYLGYYWDDAKGAWRSQQTNSSSVITSPTTPTGATAGDLWFNNNDGTLYVYYNDGISTYWTEIKANSALTTTLDDRISLIEAGNRRIPGSIVQVVQGVRSTTLVLSGITQNTFYDVGISATITPKFSTSKILITYHIQGSINYDGIVRIVRDSTVVGEGPGAGSSGSSFLGPRGNTYEGHTGSAQYLDSPNSLSAMTYKLQLTGGGTAYINRSTDSDTSERTISTITLMEVAQ